MAIKKANTAGNMQEFYRGVRYAYTRVADKLLKDAIAEFENGNDEEAMNLRDLSSKFRREAATAENDREAWAQSEAMFAQSKSK